MKRGDVVLVRFPHPSGQGGRRDLLWLCSQTLTPADAPATIQSLLKSGIGVGLSPF